MANTIRIQNLDAFMASVRQAQKECGNLSVPLRAIGLDWMKGNERVFEAAGPSGFRDLSSGKRNAKTGRVQSGGYKAEKLKKWGFVYPILKASGALERSLTRPSDPNSVFEVTANELKAGTRVRGKDGQNYPAFLQKGTSRGLPPRPYVSIPEYSVPRWIMLLRTYLVGKLKDAGSNSSGKGE